AIIGILAAVAYPSYRQHVLTSNRLEAKSSLMELSQLQENFYVENNRYASNLDSLDAGQAGFEKKGSAFISKNGRLDLVSGYYELKLLGVNTTYTLTAIALDPQTDDKSCIKFTIDNAGRKRAEDSDEQNNDKCW
ncbi:MAG: hypothetical protein KAG43_09365, partial [Candidatus Marithrix sp.]|nr:hypothetical protein [Candidatus Marithrix sp.]